MDSKNFTRAGYVNRIIDFFEHKGWREISQGNNAGAFTLALLLSNDGSKVAKISQPECDGLVDMYPEFAKWCCIKNNPHFPKIYSARALRCYGLFLTIMERLDHVDIAKISDSTFNNTPLHGVDSVALKLTRGAAVKNFAEVMGCGIGTLTKALADLIDEFGYPTDLHLGNVMRRGETLVITDPLTLNESSGFGTIPVYSVKENSY